MLCRADLGWIFNFGPANCRKIAGEFLSEFWWRILIANFSALFFQGFRSPKKFTPKIHFRNCRHSYPSSLSWTQNLFTAILCLRGRPKYSACAPLCHKNMCCASRFCTGGGGAAGSKSERMSKGPWSKMLAQGHNLRLRDEGGSEAGTAPKTPKTRTVSTCWINPGSHSLKYKYKEGDKKAHKHKSFWPVTSLVRGESPSRWPDKVLCAKVLYAFSAPYRKKEIQKQKETMNEGRDLRTSL